MTHKASDNANFAQNNKGLARVNSIEWSKKNLKTSKVHIRQNEKI